MKRVVIALSAATTALVVASACTTEKREVTNGRASADWRAPTDSEIPNDSLGASIRRGLALINHTPDSLPAFAPGAISCSNCHLNAGRVANAAPLVGSHARFPKYMERSGAVITLADRVNYCFTRSLAGTRVPTDSREMTDILAYLAWLSRDVASSDAKTMAGATGLPVLTPEMAGDRVSGENVYAAKCAVCHLKDGTGNLEASPRIPALWGPKSFSVGASMSRQSKAAAFIWHNMPFGMGKSLTPKEAWDVAAYVTSQPRPDSPGKESDWPMGGAPKDVPYGTKGHDAYLPPPVLARAKAAGTIVPPPRSVRQQ